MKRLIGLSASASSRWQRWRTRNSAPPRRRSSTRSLPASTSSPAARCTGARTTGTRRRTRCSIISGRRFRRFRAAPAPSRSPPTTRTSFIPPPPAEPASLDNIDLGLVDEFKTVSALTRKPVKITMTGPHMLAKVAYDEHYNDIGKMMDDLAKLLRHNFRMLAEAGCKHIQIDEPLFTMSRRRRGASGGRRDQHGDRRLAGRRARLDAHLPGQLRGRQGIRRRRSGTAISTPAATRPISSARSNAPPISSNTT